GVSAHVAPLDGRGRGARIRPARPLPLFGPEQEIAARGALLTGVVTPPTAKATLQAQTLAASLLEEPEFDLNLREPVTSSQGNFFQGSKELPALPQKLTPSQPARLAELLDFLHRQLTRATENIQANDDVSQVVLGFTDWQQVLAVQMLLARYVRGVAEPEALQE